MSGGEQVRETRGALGPSIGSRAAALVVGGALAALAALTALPSPASAAVSFGSKTDYASGATTRAAAIGQLDQGPIPDLAVANGSSDASVLAGTGSGSFGPRTPTNTGGVAPLSVAVGDVNNDGAADLAFAGGASISGAQSTLAVALGNGDGTFDPAVQVPGVATSSFMQSIVIGNFDADSNADLAAVDPDGNSIAVALGNGDGTFDDITTVSAGSSMPFALAVGDLDDDGELDLVTANLGSGHDSVSVFEGNGDGSFGPGVSFAAGTSTPETVAIDDLNGDGDLDIAAGSGVGPAPDVTILDGNGDGTFDAARSFPADGSVTSLAIGDLNADGNADIAAASFNTDTVAILENGGGGTFAAPETLAAGSDPQSVAIGDLNGDEKPDLVTANSGASTVSVLLNAGQPTADTSATSLDFGSRRIGTTSAAQTLTLTNDGNAALHVAGAEVVGGADDDFFLVGDACSVETLMVGESCDVRLRFSPQAAGARSATLEITDDAGDSPQEVDLSGSGTAGPTAAPSPGSLAFGSHPSGTTSPSQLVTLTNGGDEDLNVSSVFLAGADVSSFTLSGNTCDGATVAPGNSCQVAVAFAASGSGARSASLRFADDAASSPQSVSLSGTAVSSAVVASPTLSTQASADIVLGGSVTDSATLAGGQSPSGQITFRLYGPDDAGCSGAPAFTDTVAVSGNGGYISAPFTPTALGTYRWVASYSGDAGNNPAVNPCDEPAERVTVAAAPPGPEPPAPPSPTPGDPPEIDDLRLTRDAFVASAEKTPLRAAKGTKIRFVLSEDAKVNFRVRRDMPQGTGGPPPRHSHRFTRELEAGPQAVTFTGTLDGRTFKPGKYMMSVWAVDGAGERSEAQEIPFRIIRR